MPIGEENVDAIGKKDTVDKIAAAGGTAAEGTAAVGTQCLQIRGYAN